MSRDVNRYQVVQGRLRPDLMQRPENKGQPYSRPVIDSGVATKVVYLSKAPKDYTYQQLAAALEFHERKMRIELEQAGKMVRKVTRTIAGAEGDARLHMTWEVLGEKRTKHYRRAQARLNVKS